MSDKNSFDMLVQTLSEYTAAALYSPIGDEPDIMRVPEIAMALPTKRVTVPVSRTTSPDEIAADIQAQCVSERVCILIPGRAFDTYGTRHGRGNGWYDRFLQATPTSWLRIGVTNAKRFSHVRLKRQPWDQPVDWIIINDNDSVDAIKTGARSNDILRA